MRPATPPEKRKYTKEFQSHYGRNETWITFPVKLKDLLFQSHYGRNETSFSGPWTVYFAGFQSHYGRNETFVPRLVCDEYPKFQSHYGRNETYRRPGPSVRDHTVSKPLRSE